MKKYALAGFVLWIWVTVIMVSAGSAEEYFRFTDSMSYRLRHLGPI